MSPRPNQDCDYLVSFAIIIAPTENGIKETKVQAFVDVPPGEGPFDLVVNLHGGYTLPFHGHIKDNAWTAEIATSGAWPGAVALFPNYAGYGLSSGRVGSPHDDFIDTENAIKALGQMKKVHVNTNDTYLFGVSLGGDIAMMVAASDPKVKAVALDSPFPGAAIFVDWEFKYGGSLRNTTYAYDYRTAYGSNTNSLQYKKNTFNYANIHIPVLIIGGKSDPIFPPSLLRYMYAKLKKYDSEVQLRFFKGGHAVESPQAITFDTNWMYQQGISY